jgi:hypothetical protein
VAAMQRGGGSGDKHMATMGGRCMTGSGPVAVKLGGGRRAHSRHKKQGRGAADEWVRGHCEFK